MMLDMQAREAPILVVSGLDADTEMVNYRVKENTYIVDRLFERYTLAQIKQAVQSKYNSVPQGWDAVT